MLPAATVTVAGIASAALLLAKPTTNPLPVAALVSITVQVVVWPETTVEGLQPTAANCGPAVSVSANVRATPPALAVSVAL